MAKKKRAMKSDAAKALRDNAIFNAAASGFTQREIADDLEISPATVWRALNSEEAKRLVDQGRAGLMENIGLAVQTLVDAMQSRYDNMGVAVKAATDLLKGVGALTEKTEVTVMKPFIYEDLEGKRIVMGHKPAGQDEEE